MAEEKESSVLFSLKELMTLEEDRIASEEEEAAAKARAAQAAREAAEAAARSAADQRIHEEEERRRSEEQRRKEEEARIDAIRQVEIERGRAESEHRAQMAVLAAQQAHEQRLAAVQSDSGKKKLKIAVAVVASILVIGAVLGSVLFYDSGKKAEEERAALAGQAKQAEARVAQLETDVEASRQKERALQAKVSNAKNEAHRIKLQVQRAAAKEETNKARQAIGRARRPKSGGEKACKCALGDPLCGCLSP